MTIVIVVIVVIVVLVVIVVIAGTNARSLTEVKIPEITATEHNAESKEAALQPDDYIVKETHAEHKEAATAALQTDEPDGRSRGRHHGRSRRRHHHGRSRRRQQPQDRRWRRL